LKVFNKKINSENKFRVYNWKNFRIYFDYHMLSDSNV
jgi:hypothetical protein